MIGRLADDFHPIRAARLGRLRPVGSQVFAQPGDVFDDDRRMAVDHAADLELQRGHRSLGDAPDRDIEVFRRRLALVGLGDLVQFDTQACRQLTDRRTPGDAEHAR